MPPKLLNDYGKGYTAYRDRERYGGHTCLFKLANGDTACDADGNPLMFNHAEVCEIERNGKTFAEVIAARPGVYPKATPLMDKPKRGRKAK